MAGMIVRQFSPERIVLLGSRARGDAREDSDVDLLVLFAKVDDPCALASRIYGALAVHCGLPKDIVVSTTARFDRYRDVVNTIHWSAAREGKVLYERAA